MSSPLKKYVYAAVLMVFAAFLEVTDDLTAACTVIGLGNFGRSFCKQSEGDDA